MSHNHSEHLNIDDEKVHVFYIDFDFFDNGEKQNKEGFYNELFNDIPAFAFGTDRLNEKASETSNIIPVVREAMKKLYEIPGIKSAQKEYLNSTSTEDKYLKRGEFGELLLYHLLHEYFNADALISKIYFKDSASIPAHGFDAVHVDLVNETLWLGESKLYIDPNRAINELVKDVESHFNRDFFHSEFQIITNRVHDDKGDKYPEFIKKLIDPETNYLAQLANINIALFAGFTSKSLKDHDEADFLNLINSEIDKLKSKADKGLDKHPLKDHLNIFLFFFPLDDKRAFVASMHRKLKAAQQV